MTPTLDEVLARVRELSEKATKGPWFKRVSVVGLGSPKLYVRAGTPGGEGVALVQDITGRRAENADLIAEYRTLAPRLAEALKILVAHVRGFHFEMAGFEDPETREWIPAICHRCQVDWPCGGASALAVAEQAMGEKDAPK